jgi:hypothetical protein
MPCVVVVIEYSITPEAIKMTAKNACSVRSGKANRAHPEVTNMVLNW